MMTNRMSFTLPIAQTMDSPRLEENPQLGQVAQGRVLGNPLAGGLRVQVISAQDPDFFGCIERFNDLVEQEEEDASVLPIGMCCCSDSYHLQKSEGKLSIVKGSYCFFKINRYTQGVAKDILDRFTSLEIPSSYSPLLRYLIRHENDLENLKRLIVTFVSIELERLSRVRYGSSEPMVLAFQHNLGTDLVEKISRVFHKNINIIFREAIVKLTEDLVVTAVVRETEQIALTPSVYQYQ